MGDEPVGADDESLDETESKNVTLKRRTFQALEAQYPHALDDPERIRAAIHDALENSRDSSDADETE
ncbi:MULTISPECIES: hypothetical protein [Halobacteriales]|uniref:Uncharacterized protein n=2 Tax=Halobacteriales TaxID=2235 RepID=A0A1I0QZG2_9EURY|nr:hypothetical protein [Natrinema salifodinae]SEW32838.1 hypothetical protein SAMN05216285_4155 [Natrinema salifodinae]